MMREDIRQLIAQMTLEEKAGMCSGADFWQLKGIERLEIPSVKVTDGPHGLRMQDEQADLLGINQSIEAVCFPTGCAAASSFDRKLLKRIGEAIGRECQAKGISTILGPAMNIKRSPLCGRNFEYYSEDPLVTSQMAAALAEGVQSQNVGTSMKHFLANNQEKRRINGTYVGESKEYLTDILRDEWGFDGYVISDWGAVNDCVEALKAGMDLEMPASGGILNIVFRFTENQQQGVAFEYERDHKLAAVNQ